MKNTKKKKRIGCFILSRMSSTRLPGKTLLPIRGKPVIQHIIERAKLMSSADVFVLCTSNEKNDDALERIAQENDIEIFRGSLADVLERFLGATEKFNVDIFAIFSGDNVFCDPELANLGVSQMINNNLDFITIPDDLVCGGSAYCISTRALKRACELKTTNNTEYFPIHFTARKEFNVGNLRIDDPIYHNTNVRLTLDYPEDLEFLKRVFNEFGTDINNIPLRKIMELLKRKPEIAYINFFRQKDWSNNQKPMKILR